MAISFMPNSKCEFICNVFCEFSFYVKHIDCSVIHSTLCDLNTTFVFFYILAMYVEIKNPCSPFVRSFFKLEILKYSLSFN